MRQRSPREACRLALALLVVLAWGRHAGAAEWNRPERLTREAGLEYCADWHPDAGLVYVAGEDGAADLAWRRRPRAVLEPPRPLAGHPARDRWPRFDPAGRRVAFVSTRQDGAGDLYLVALRKLPLISRLRRVTDAATVDDHPCWHPDGRIVYASAPRLGAPFDLWAVKPGGEPVRLSAGGGQMPDCSPDGRHVAYVVPAGGGRTRIEVLRMADGAVARLSTGDALDLHPAFSRDGRRLYFARAPFDTDGDGRLGPGDASSIYSAAFSTDLFTGGELPPVRQLTTLARSDSFPRATDAGFVFTRAVRPGNVDLFALPAAGEAPDLGNVGGSLAFAERADAEHPDDLHRRLLAWQNAAWAAREGGARAPAAAEAWLGMGRVLRELGREKAARQAFAELIELFPGAERRVGLAQAELLALGRSTLADGDEEAWRRHLEEARDLREHYDALARRARREGESAEAHALERTAALAQLELGRAHLSRGDYADAVEALRAVERDYPDHPVARSQALLSLADAYSLLGEAEAASETCMRALRARPDAAAYARKVAARIVEMAAGRAAGTEERVAALRSLIEEAGEDVPPVLPALAQNRIGDLLYARGELERALDAYRRTVERHPDRLDQAAAASLAVARLHAESDEFDRAAEVLGALLDRSEGTGDAALKAVREAYARTLIRKADRELELGDTALALDTYARLRRFDPGGAAGHRGAVRCYALLGRAGDAVLAYRERVEAEPGDHVARYALALAQSYYGPSDWVGDPAAARLRVRLDRQATELLEGAIRAEPDVPYYHQLRGFLLSRLALAEDEEALKPRALDAYMAALGLSRPEEDPANHANLLFNVGEGYTLLDRPEAAYGYYRRALDAGFDPAGARRGAGLTQIARSAVAAGDYPQAVRLLREALVEPADEGDPAALTARAERLDWLGMAHHLDGSYVAAAEVYSEYAALVERLVAERPQRAGALRRNLLRAERNMAVNLYMAVERGEASPERLARARRLLRGALERLDAVGVAAGGEGGRGLLTVDVEVALAGATGRGEFDAGAEKRLLYSYLARIEAARGDRAEAARYLRRKLELYPETDEPAGRTERAVVWTQIGAFELEAGQAAAAVDAYRRAAELEGRAGNLRGEAAATLALGRALLRAAEAAPGAVAPVLQRHRDVLTRIRAEEAPGLAPLEAALRANLSALGRIRPSEERP